MGGAATNTMATLLSDLTTVFTQFIGCVATICSTVVGQPLLLLTVGFLFVGGILGLFRRMLSST